ncbi:sugar kinase [Aestuariispira insulae]|uniref:2-dehydro-3-deoxygluconokinase n=1 Tax=Aestuariispira insulae TaxID=1461337 RepID=A0A3D9HMW7_9PROT|nr:sugar kinase [Aestuariispira insulae]RED50809.1 2-keto-3-deoxygluconate kinase [Aestuariispira insulae]
MKIGIIGECMVELSDGPDGSLNKAFSGDTFNTAVYLARCDRDREFSIDYVTALGDDLLSSEMIKLMARENVGSGLIHRFVGDVPGLYMIHLDDQGERSFSYWRSQAPARKLFERPDLDQLLANLMEKDWLYLSGISVAILPVAGREMLKSTLSDFRHRGGKVCFDINYRPRLWKDKGEAAREIAAFYRHCDMALPSFDDESSLFGSARPADVIDRLAGLGCCEVVVKNGAGACVVYTGEETREVEVPTVGKVVDSTAAGDSFNAGYLYARFKNMEIVQAVEAGQQIARQVISAKGAIVPIDPTIIC